MSERHLTDTTGIPAQSNRRSPIWWLALVAVASLAIMVFSRATPTFIDRAYRGELTVPPAACAASAPCPTARKVNLEIGRQGLLLPFAIANVGDLYALNRWLKDRRFSLVRDGDSSQPLPASIQPAYDTYSNYNEVGRTVDVRLELPFSKNVAYDVFVDDGYGPKLVGHVTVGATWMGKLLWHLPDPAKHYAADVPVALNLAALLCLAIGFAMAAPVRGDRPGANRADALTMRFALLGALLGIAWIIPLSTSVRGFVMLPLAIAVVLPWRTHLWRRNTTSGGASESSAPGFGARLSERIPELPQAAIRPVALCTILAILAGFLWILCASGSFRWSMFEERDFLEARHLFDHGFAPLGPGLLAGGHTLGDAVYWLYKPVVMLWNDPRGLAIFTKVLYFLSAVLLWATVRRHVSEAAAIFAMLIFVSAGWIIGLAYWPIHPNISLFFSLCYLALVLQGFRRPDPRFLIAASLLLGFLVQLHFSYYLFVIPQFALLARSPSPRRARLIAGSIAAFLLPLVPYFAWDASHGFANIRQMLEHPRFQKSYVPVMPFVNDMLPRHLPAWFDGMHTSLPFVRRIIVVTALLAGLFHSFRSMLTLRLNGTIPAAVIAGAYLFVPLGFLLASGAGYAQRHMLLIVPAAFVLLAIGFDHVIGKQRNLRVAMGSVLIAAVMLDWSTALFRPKRVEAATQELGEWAKDYDNRTAVAQYLISKMGVSPERYEQSAYWWWFGWAIEPESYRDIALALPPDGAGAQPPKDFDYVLMTDLKGLPPFLANVFRSETEATVGDVTITRAWVKNRPEGAPYSGNGRTCTRPSPLENTLDLLHASDGVHAVTLEGATGPAPKLARLVVLANGRIKMLLTLDPALTEGKPSLAWRVESASLCGLYWEIKTVWRPRLVLHNKRTGEDISAALVDGVMGNLLHKTPLSGAVPLPSPADEWSASFAASGYFDQSAMAAPAIEEISLPLDEPTDAGQEMILRAGSQ